MTNIWDEEMKQLYRELVLDYLDEGYDRQEAQNMAKAEVLEMFGEAETSAFSIVSAAYED